MRNLRYPLVSNDTILYRADCTRRKVFMVVELVIGSQSFSLVREDYLYATQFQGTKSLSNIRSNYKGELQKKFQRGKPTGSQHVSPTQLPHLFHYDLPQKRCSLVSPIQPLVERLLDFWLMRRIIPNPRPFRNETGKTQDVRKRRPQSGGFTPGAGICYNVNRLLLQVLGAVPKGRS